MKITALVNSKWADAEGVANAAFICRWLVTDGSGLCKDHKTIHGVRDCDSTHSSFPRFLLCL